jgi:hypothetical protein
LTKPAPKNIPASVRHKLLDLARKRDADFGLLQQPHEGLLRSARPGRIFAFDGGTLAEAIRNTVRQRGTELPPAGIPLAFTPDFYEDRNKAQQWTAFCAKNKTYIEPIEYKTVIAAIAHFLVPVARSVREGTSFAKTWQPGGPWR